MTDHGMKGRRNAAKPDDKRASSTVQFRVTPRQKAGYVKQAQREGKNLSEWVVGVLERELERGSSGKTVNQHARALTAGRDRH